jgi:IS30 family transposase
MSNKTSNHARNKWTNSELSSLALWHNEGLPIDEIAKRLNRSTSAIVGVINNKRPVLRLSGTNHQKILSQQKNTQTLVLHQVQYVDNLIMIIAITKLNENYFQARAMLATADLIKSQNVLLAEFNTVDACMRWFETLPEQFYANQ